MALRIFNFVFAALFLVSLVLQYNDPDPLLWMAIYGYGAMLSFLAARGRFYPKAYVAGIAAFAVYAVFLFFTKDGVLDWYREHDAENIAQSMKATHPWIEDTREFFGLVILIIVLAVNLVAHNRRVRSAV